MLPWVGLSFLPFVGIIFYKNGRLMRSLRAVSLLLLPTLVLFHSIDAGLVFVGGFTLVLAGICLLYAIVWWRRDLSHLCSSRIVLPTLILLLVATGLARGMTSGFAVTLPDGHKEFFMVQQWARANTSPGTTFHVVGRANFPLFARRPVWWDESHFSAVLWEPKFYALWNCRRQISREVMLPASFADLMRDERIEFLVIPTKQYASADYGRFPVRFQTENWLVLQAPEALALGQPTTPRCPS
jgi:hypothetical protein